MILSEQIKEDEISMRNKLNVFDSKDIFSSFYFHPQTIKKQQNYETNFLLDDGTNLAYFLDELYKNDKEAFEDISNSLIGEVELINSIEITQGSVPTIVFNEEVNNKTKKIILPKVSDGTIHFLSIISALYGSKSNCLVFEEPERHMHLKTLSYILDSFRDSQKQIFFTTHSTEILNQLKLDEILFLFRDFDGNTKGQRAKDIPNIKKIMKRYKNDLVEMIQTGVVGEYEE
jgi:predicted ATPase